MDHVIKPLWKDTQEVLVGRPVLLPSSELKPEAMLKSSELALEVLGATAAATVFRCGKLATVVRA